MRQESFVPAAFLFFRQGQEDETAALHKRGGFFFLAPKKAAKQGCKIASLMYNTATAHSAWL